MAALDIRSGRRVWQRDVAGANTPWLAGDFMYVVSTDQKLAAIGRDDGSVHWVTDLPRFQNPKRSKGLITWSGPVLVGGKLILVSDHAKMAVVDPDHRRPGHQQRAAATRPPPRRRSRRTRC